MFTKCLFSASKSNFAAMWKSFNPSKLMCASERFTIPNMEIVRFKARKGTRIRKQAIAKANKLKKANKPPPIPKYLQRKIKVSPDLQRRRCVDENWSEIQPIDNVYNMKLYRGKPYPVSQAIDELRSRHMPSILNDPTALVYVTIELELKLKKKENFLKELNGVMTFPHEFESTKKNRVVVICKEPEDQIKASEAGAVYTGSTTLIKQILSGTLTSDDFDYVVCHPDMYKELNVLRGILKKKYPNTNNGLLRLDLERAVTSFIKGIEYEMKHSALEPDFGWVEMCCGRLNMPTTEIEENLKHGLNIIEKHKPAGTDHLLFILRTLLWCEKSKPKFKIPHWGYLENYPENGVLINEDNKTESHG